MGAIRFFSEEVKFSLSKKLQVKNWLKEVIASEGSILDEINFIFCSDLYLHKLNLDFLNHDDFTDILTFDKSEEKGIISGDIYISIERVKENAETLHQEFVTELKRVMAHGTYHLLGYKDKSAAEKELMTQKENGAIRRWASIDVPRGTSMEGS